MYSHHAQRAAGSALLCLAALTACSDFIAPEEFAGLRGEGLQTSIVAIPESGLEDHAAFDVDPPLGLDVDGNPRERIWVRLDGLLEWKDGKVREAELEAFRVGDRIKVWLSSPERGPIPPRITWIARIIG